jgi:aryl-alcohol dehydrogenase-like predicted oxidoreductase
MRTVALVGTQLSSSRLGFGLSSLHHVFRSRDRQSLLAAAYDSGIRYFDASPYYGHGLAERELGVFGAGGRRGRILISTKFGIEPDPWQSRYPGLMYARLAANAALRRVTGRNALIVQQKRDYTASNAVKSLDRSLRALRTDHVDFLYLHEPVLSELGDAAPLIDTLQRLQSSGKVRYFGLSGAARECIDIARRHPSLSNVLQIDASLGDETNLLKAASIPFHITFGHFRDKAAPIDELAASAIGANAHGVILFSTRSAARVRAMASLLASLEPS